MSTMGTGEGNTAVIAFYFYDILFKISTKLSSLTLSFRFLFFQNPLIAKAYFQNLIYEITVFLMCKPLGFFLPII